MIVSKEFKWCMSHRLENHERLCKNVHGHNYKMVVYVETLDGKEVDNKLTNEGMVCDFTYLKKIVNEIIVDRFDHAFVYNEKDKTNTEIANFLICQINQKVLPLPVRTTAEKMSEWIYNELNKHFNVLNINLKCDKIELYETDESMAIYTKV